MLLTTEPFFLYEKKVFFVLSWSFHSVVFIKLNMWLIMKLVMLGGFQLYGRF
jgi:hypothetical protein